MRALLSGMAVLRSRLLICEARQHSERRWQAQAVRESVCSGKRRVGAARRVQSEACGKA